MKDFNLKNKLRAGLIGFGVMGKNHARILSNLDNVELIGIADPFIPNQIDSFLDGAHFYKDSVELLNQELDYCVIAVPTNLHKNIAILALENGVNCLIEKPIAVNYIEGIEIESVAKKYNLLVGIGHIERYNAAVQQLKIRLLKGELGQIFQISTRRLGPHPVRINDVGVVKDLATHDIDLIMWLMESNFKTISAHSYQNKAKIVEELVSVNGLLENGIIVNMQINWVSPYKERKIVVTGEKGTFVVDTLNSELIYFENGNHMVSQEALMHLKGVSQGNCTSFAFDRPEPLLVEHQNFRDKILGRSAEIISIKEGLSTIKIADFFLKSSKIGSSIEL